MYICTYYMLITFLVILTCSFQKAAILILICSASHTNNHGNFTCGIQMYIWPYYMLITVLVILTYIFEMVAIWYVFLTYHSYALTYHDMGH